MGKILGGGKNKRKEKANLEQLVSEALAVAKTPEDVAQYLLALDDNNYESGDKKALYAAILAD